MSKIPAFALITFITSKLHSVRENESEFSKHNNYPIFQNFQFFYNSFALITMIINVHWLILFLILFFVLHSLLLFLPLLSSFSPHYSFIQTIILTNPTLIHFIFNLSFFTHSFSCFFVFFSILLFLLFFFLLLLKLFLLCYL